MPVWVFFKSCSDNFEFREWNIFTDVGAMKSSLISKEVLPFVALFVSLILVTILVDVFLHQFGMVWLGRWLGVPGVLFILLSFLYSMRKRKFFKSGKPKTFLRLHEIFTWIGALLILVHAGIHIFTILPWLAVVAMLTNVISGMTGTYLLNRSRRFLKQKKEKYAQAGLSEDEIEKQIFMDATTYDLMKKWRIVHLPITAVFVVLSVWHILSILMFWNLK